MAPREGNPAPPTSRLTGAARVYGVLGHPVTHSLSPAMHNAAFAALGLDAVYVPFPVQPEELPQAVAGLKAAGVCGFNLTVPHKTAILPLLADMLPEARTVGAVNTVRCDEMRLIGANTDGIGFLLSLAQDLDFSPKDASVLMLGAGGAARAIAFALLGAGTRRLWIANRTPGKAQSLAADCLTRFPGAEVRGWPLQPAALAGMEPDLVVQTTTVGMGAPGNRESPLALASLGVRQAVIDIVYHPLETAILAEARSLGLRTANGIGMLLYQGAEAFRFWTEREPPVDTMREALIQALAARP